MMTLPEFLASGTCHFVKDAAQIIGEHPDTFEGYAAVWLYGDTCWLGENLDGTFHTLVERSEWGGTRTEVATALYMDHYLWLDNARLTTVLLARALARFCAWRGLEIASADEMQHEILAIEPEKRSPADRYNAAWLGWFIDAWNETQAREDSALPGCGDLTRGDEA